MYKGYFRAAACVPKVTVADCKANAASIIDLLDKAAEAKADLAVFPEMCITAYTCADLFHNNQLLDSAQQAILEIARHTESVDMPPAILGAPVRVGNALYNCAIIVHGGHIHGIVPKTYLPNYNEFYEKRWWQPAPEMAEQKIKFCNQQVSFGTKQLFRINQALVGVEICEDLWTPIPPSCRLALAGAQIVANLSASDDLIGKYAYLRSLIAQQSARCICGYVYSSAGFGESSTDLVFDGKAIVAENGTLLACNERWQSNPQIVITDIDVETIMHDRMRTGSYNDCASRNLSAEYQIHDVTDNKPSAERQLMRRINSKPFVPPTDAAMAERCSEIINIQAAGLAKRLHHIRCEKLVIGISGGLDSTLALLVAVKAYDRLGLDRKGIIGITMPGMGTSARTKDNAVMLMDQLGISASEISIEAAVRQHFSDIGQDPDVHDVTYENSQARERTQILMDMANKVGGIVLGTGDLSELALGWATYNGDHMSMYAVNTGVPKTLVRYLVQYFAQDPAYASCRATLLDIIDTPISPELTPTDSEGKIAQKTEDLVGPYVLHDFFLYYTLRYGLAPDRIYYMARHAFGQEFSDDVILHWLKVYYRRFFQQQFKRSCLPDGPKVGSVCLSPRGDWRMPSDASAAQWLEQVEKLS